MSLLPSRSSLTAIPVAASDDAQAASTVKLVPPKSSRLAIRPAATFIRIPAKLSSVHSGSRSNTCRCSSGSSIKRRERRADRVADRQIRAAAAGAEDHRRALAIERPGRVAGIAQRRLGGDQRQQLERLDRGHRLRWHPDLDRRERDRVDEPAPARVDLVGSARVGVVHDPPVPAPGGDLGDRVDLAEDVRPQRPSIGRPGQDAGHPDDRDVGRRWRRGVLDRVDGDRPRPAVRRWPSTRRHAARPAW